MFQILINLVILYFVIFDPLISLPVFMSITKNMSKKERARIASLAITTASIISAAFILFGMKILELFSTTLGDFKVAGGIILGILGIQMVLGKKTEEHHEGEAEAKGVAVLIGSPLLTGPAAMTTILITVADYGMMMTALAVGIVLIITGLLLVNASSITKYIPKTTMKVISTMMGLITLSWGVAFMRAGLGF